MASIYKEEVLITVIIVIDESDATAKCLRHQLGAKSATVVLEFYSCRVRYVRESDGLKWERCFRVLCWLTVANAGRLGLRCLRRWGSWWLFLFRSTPTNCPYQQDKGSEHELER
jgi:hypothetical protein